MLGLKKLLYPVSWLYRLITFFRNKLFDWNILKEKEYAIPVICVGNLTVGGTGKTPHIEYLVNLLKNTYKIAVLSRGYKRKTHGFLLATPGVKVVEIGDEPYQIYSKYPDIIVAVSESRRKGIEELLKLEGSKRPEIILLDDAFQHRYVKPGYSILLMDYNRLPYKDSLLPVGNQREPFSAKKRANMVLVTKCSENITPMEMLLIRKELSLFPYQSVFFTRFKYLKLLPLYSSFADVKEIPLSEETSHRSVLLVTGIAYTKPLTEALQGFNFSIEKHLKYPDHYWYNISDIEKIIKAFKEIEDVRKVIVFTEKDAMKIFALNITDEEIRSKMYYIPIEVDFLNNQRKEFDQIIEKYVITDKRNSILS
ncbi:MAG: tetraacyldisaccharide 4'-kinase [Candidatus Azobacteroides sp.]|nr:tetraacyldisaccharide 4'-kinase [Candidatus Azobacteroides sp.]